MELKGEGGSWLAGEESETLTLSRFYGISRILVASNRRQSLEFGCLSKRLSVGSILTFGNGIP